MINFFKLLAFLFLAFPFASCTRGLLYTHTVEPLTVNMYETRKQEEVGSGKNFRLSDPITLPLRVEWASLGIGDIAKRSDFEIIEYADIETFSVLLGLFQTQKVILRGKKKFQE